MFKTYLTLVLFFPIFLESAIPPSQTVIVNSEPAGAKVQLNGRYVGETPLEINIDPSQKSNFIYLSKNGYKGIRFDLTRFHKEVTLKLPIEEN